MQYLSSYIKLKTNYTDFSENEKSFNYKLLLNLVTEKIKLIEGLNINLKSMNYMSESNGCISYQFNFKMDLEEVDQELLVEQLKVNLNSKFIVDDFELKIDMADSVFCVADCNIYKFEDSPSSPILPLVFDKDDFPKEATEILFMIESDYDGTKEKRDLFDLVVYFHDKDSNKVTLDSDPKWIIQLKEAFKLVLSGEDIHDIKLYHLAKMLLSEEQINERLDVLEENGITLSNEFTFNLFKTGDKRVDMLNTDIYVD
jgi:hypothetical protein